MSTRSPTCAAAAYSQCNASTPVCTLHTMGLKAILQDLHDLEALGSNETFYPVSTTAIVLCSKLCDACGLMRQPAMLGAIKPEALTLLLQTPPPTPLAADLWSCAARSRAPRRL